MNNLLDTHTFIWFIEDSKELSSKAKKIIEADDAINYVSIASLWEIAIKTSLQKLELKKAFSQINKEREKNGFIVLPISFDDVLAVSVLPFHHKDPFDRIIAAQGANKNYTVITRDENISLYGVKTLW